MYPVYTINFDDARFNVDSSQLFLPRAPRLFAGGPGVRSATWIARKALNQRRRNANRASCHHGGPDRGMRRRAHARPKSDESEPSSPPPRCKHIIQGEIDEGDDIVPYLSIWSFFRDGMGLLARVTRGRPEIGSSVVSTKKQTTQQHPLIIWGLQSQNVVNS